MQTESHPFMAAAFLFGIGLPGAIALVTTETSHLDQNLIEGAFQRSYEDDFASNVPLHNQASAAYTAVTLALFRQAGPEVVIGKQDWLFTAEEFRPASTDVDFAATLADVHERLAAQGISLIPVIVPDKARVYADTLPRARGAEIEHRYDALLSELDSQGFPVIDLHAALVDARAQGETFMRTDTHWSPLGARIAAETVSAAATLQEAGNNSFETLIQDRVGFDGDLLVFADTGTFAPWVGIAPETIAAPITMATNPEQGLFGDTEIDIVLVGTSFSARAEFDFAGALQAATGLNLVNLATQGRGPFVPMQEALNSGAITDFSPTYVVWELPERYIQTRVLP